MVHYKMPSYLLCLGICKQFIRDNFEVRRAFTLLLHYIQTLRFHDFLGRNVFNIDTVGQTVACSYFVSEV